MIVTPGPGPEECQHLRWATGGLRVVPLGLVGKLCEPGSQDHQACTTAGRLVYCQVGILWPRTGCLSGQSRQDLLESFACRALKTILLTLPLGGRCLDRSGSSGLGPGAFPGSPSRTCWKSFVSWALGNIEFTLLLGGRCAFRSGSSGPGYRNRTLRVTACGSPRVPRAVAGRLCR